MVKIIPYDPKLKSLAKKLRKNMTFGEALLWNELKRDKLSGFDFDRQRCIDKYIVDFYCKNLQLAIEIDGISHNDENAFIKDEIRQRRLEELGITVIRFTEAEVKYDMENVLRSIECIIIDVIKIKRLEKLPIGLKI